MAELDLSLTPHIRPSPRAWLQAVFADFDSFLKDHASCEKKASGMALNVAAHYPDQPILLSAMVDLAVEELTHYREVVKVMHSRGIHPGPDTKDAYVNALNGHIRRGTERFLLDRLLVGAIVERRGAERFALIADNLADTDLPSDLVRFYTAIASSEERHWTLFLELALEHCPQDEVWSRLHELAAIENALIDTLPVKAALH